MATSATVLFTLLTFGAVLVHSEVPKLHVEALEKVVRGGEQFDFVCRAGRPIESCSMTFAHSGSSIRVRENAKKLEYEYLGQGFQKGDCGIRYYAVKSEQHGRVQCTVSYTDIDDQSVAFTNLLVAIAPTDLDLNTNKKEFVAGDKLHITCKAPGARPAANLTLNLENVTLANSTNNQDSVDFSKEVTFKDNNKKLSCSAAHPALNASLYAEKNLTVYFKPQHANYTAQQFNFHEGKAGKVVIEVHANPKPTFEWKVNGEKPDGTNYIVSSGSNSTIQNKETGAWVAELLISAVAQDDLKKEYVLNATNKYGSETYKINITIEPRPGGFKRFWMFITSCFSLC